MTKGFTLKNVLFEKYVDCQVSREEYDRKRAALDERQRRLERELKEGKKKEREHDVILNGMNGWMQAVRKAGKRAKVTKELVDELVDRVLVFENKRVEIVFRFVEEREELERLIAELEDMEEDNEAEETDESESIPGAETEECISSENLSEESEAGSSGWV